MPNKSSIVFVLPSFSHDGIKGFEKVVLQWIDALKANYSIHVVNIGGQKNLTTFDDKLGVTIHERAINKFSKVFYAFLALLRLRPLQSEYLTSKSTINYIAQLQRKYSVKANIFVTIRTHCAGKNSEIPKNIMLAVDSMTLNFAGKYKKSRFFGRILFFAEYILLKLGEENILSEYNNIVFVSDRDAQNFNGVSPKVIPLSTEIPTIIEKKIENKVKILFTGNMSYEPNRTAVAWFYRQVYLKFKLEMHKVEFVVCGRFAEEWQFLTGLQEVKVKSDVLDIFEEILDCDIYIAPMQSGSGMQFKIIEAMACAKPVITTRLGLGSIVCEGSGKDIIIADTPKEVFEAIKALSQNSKIRRDIGSAARVTVKNNYGKDIVGQKVRELLRAV